MTTTVEEWRPIPGWPEYEVSSIGSVRRIAVYHTSRVGRILKLRATRTGYLRAALCRDSAVRHQLVHRLVALAFLPAPQPGQDQVAHNNGDKTDNTVGNLRWDSAEGNAADRWEHGTYHSGEQHFAAKVTWEVADKIRAARKLGSTLRQIANQFGLSKTTVGGIARNERWNKPGPNGQTDTKALEKKNERACA